MIVAIESQLEQARQELEQKLRAGQACSAESLAAKFPQAWSDADSALELIYSEFALPHATWAGGPIPTSTCAAIRNGASGWPEFCRSTSWSGPSSNWPTRHPMTAYCPIRCRSMCRQRVKSAVMNCWKKSPAAAWESSTKARQVSLNRVVALKMILAGEFASAEQRQRFRREAELAVRLQHPNIVQIFEVGQEDGRPYLAMEYVPGISLDRQLALGDFQRAGVTPGDAAQFVETLARAVHFAHQNGVVHRDLKPANVLLSDAGERQSTDVYKPMAVPKITDFGLAKALDETSERTGSGEFVGTPCYMAPEQATGGGVVGPAADIYALGAILYELIAGRPPLQGATLADTLSLLRDTEPLPPKQRYMRVPRDLATICLKCLSKDPARRMPARKRWRTTCIDFGAVSQFRPGRFPAWSERGNGRSVGQPSRPFWRRLSSSPSAERSSSLASGERPSDRSRQRPRSI